MTREIEISFEDLEVIGYADDLPAEMLPRLVAPIFRRLSDPSQVILPPLRFREDGIIGFVQSTEADFDQAISRGQATRIDALAAQPNYQLWIDQDRSPHYAPATKVSERLREIAKDHVRRAKIALTAESYDEASRLAQIAIAADERCLDALLVKAIVLRRLGHDDEVDVLRELAGLVAPDVDFGSWIDLYAQVSPPRSPSVSGDVEPSRIKQPSTTELVTTIELGTYAGTGRLPRSGPVGIPERIARLPEVAYDLSWAWNPSARRLFEQLDPNAWRLSGENPVRMLRIISETSMERAAVSQAFQQAYDAVVARHDQVRSGVDSWWSNEFKGFHESIAYFSAEFALHWSLPIYAGGLGVLAGDHCKEASDLGVPLLGVGFMYPQGYFHQRLSTDGWQEETYERLDWSDVPIQPAITGEGAPCVTAVPLGDRIVLVSVWRVSLGRVQLLLLDTDLEENAPWDRELSARLYGGDRETRLQQEIVLGIGGVRALRMLGYRPAVWHLNEAHAAFSSMERIRAQVEAGETFEAALSTVRRATVFSDHTPLFAGHDSYPFHLIETHLAGSWQHLGRYRQHFLTLGEYDSGSGAAFNMTALALRTSGRVNAVSRAHRDVTHSMWSPLWPGVPQSRTPVIAVTNGIHLPTWVSAPMQALFERHLGADWRYHQDDQGFWDSVMAIPDEDLWAARRVLRTALFTFIGQRARRHWREGHASPARLLADGMLLNPNVLTIGFARRFAAYKRADLVFQDADRLARILTDNNRPVQMIFAGKVHPADDVGRHHLQQIYRRALDPKFGGHIAFVEDYDLRVAPFLVHGCDIWLNTPRKPLEASGTSGMKASVNGVLHLSVEGGWWSEAYNGKNGWSIKTGASAAGDLTEASELYRLLENEIVPTYYERDERDIPGRWLQIVKEAIRTIAPAFSTTRMVKEYANRMYVPRAEQTVGDRPHSSR
jgi:starch phosphorylase